MLTNLVSLTHAVENRVCQFICQNDTPIAVIKEAMFEFLKYVGKIEDAAKAQQEAQKVEPVVSDKVEPIVDSAPVAIEGNEHA